MTSCRRTDIQIRREQGQATVEFAIVLPILAVLLLGIVQFGILLNNYVTLTDASRAGARKAVVSRPLGVSAATSAVRDAVLSSAGGLKASDVNVTVTSPTWDPGADVTVTATYPYSINVLGVVLKSGRLSSSTTERLE